MKNKKPCQVHTVARRVHLRMLRGYLPYFRCLRILDMTILEARAYIKAGKIPQPKVISKFKYYTVDQLACLIQAKFYATVPYRDYMIFSINRMSEYLKKYWPQEEHDESGGKDSKTGEA